MSAPTDSDTRRPPHRPRLGWVLAGSHLLVAILAIVATFLVVRVLAVRLFDMSLRPGQGPSQGNGMGPGMGNPGAPAAGVGANGMLRQQMADAVQNSFIWGALIGLAVALIVAGIVTGRITRPIRRVRDATRRIARGDYHANLPSPGTAELADLAVDVRTLADRLADTEARRSRLLGEVGHEMRTPLTVIDGYVEGMIDQVLPASPDNLTLIGEESRRLARLADDLTALSRAEEGRMSVQPRPVDLAEIVGSCVQRLRPQAQDADVQLTLTGTDRPLELVADPARVGQIITNLIGNALRATPRGGRIDVHVGVHQDEAEVTVSDTGEGISPDDLERIFERFYRVPGRRTAGSDTGTGIGLTIARSLARQHQGSLTAASAGLGQGATFTLRLPLRRRTA